MKKLPIIMLIITQIIAIKTVAQNNSILNTKEISNKDIVGLWQINTPKIYDNPLECFQFFNNGTFIYNYDSSDDTRKVVKLKGEYFMKDDKLFFTIKARIEHVSNNIVTGASGSDEFIFVLDSDSTRVVTEKNPKQLDPVSILNVIKTSKYFSMKINNRKYYKLSSNPVLPGYALTGK